ncbi:unnamed protein product, partial [Scytosiphon promiscuus]
SLPSRRPWDRARTLLKEKEVPGYDRSMYTCERTAAKTRDGVEVPMSIVYRKDVYPDGLAGKQAPCMLYGYGSYGASIEPTFDFTRFDGVWLVSLWSKRRVKGESRRVVG